MADLTQEDISNLTSSMKEMTKVIENNNKLLLKSGDIYNNTKNTQKEISKNLEKQGKLYKDNTAEIKKQNALIQNTKELAGDILSSFTKLSIIFTSGGIVGAVGKIVKDAISLDNVTTALAARMGKMVQKAELKGAVNSLQADLGATYDAAVGIVSTLSSKRYVDNITEAAKGANLFSRATGMGYVEVANLMTELNKGAHLSTSSINAMLTGIVKVQQNIGLSEEGMVAATESIKKAAVNMSAFGKSSTDIQKMANHTTALVGAMEKVGIAAGDAAQLVDRLTDPDRIEDNILLYSQLGVSMEDALSGNFDLSNMDGQLKEMAQRIVDMGPIAGSQFAKSMGMSYKQATQMAKMEGNEVAQVGEAAQTAEDGALDTMQQLEKQTEGFGKSMETAFNKIEGKIRGLPKIALVAGGLLIATILSQAKKKLMEFSQDVTSPKQMSVLTEGIGSAVALGFNKGLSKAGQALLETGKVAKRGLEQWFDSTKVGGFFDGTEKRIDALMAKANHKTFSDVYLESARKNRVDMLNEHKNLLEDQKQAELNKLEELLDAKQKKILRDNKNKSAALSVIDGMVASEEGGATGAYAARLKAIQEIIKAYQSEENQQKRINTAINKREAVSKEVAKHQEYVAQKAEKLNKAEEGLASLQEEISKNTEKIATAEAESGRLNKLIAEAKSQGTEASAALVKKLEEQKAEQEAILNVAQKEKAVQEAQKAGREKALKDAREEVDAAEDLLRRAKDNEKIQSKISKLAIGIKDNILTAASAKFNASTFGKAFNAAKGAGVSGPRAALAGTGAIAKKGAAGAGKAIASGIGGIMKSLGPMAIVMAVVGKFIDKFRQPLENLIDNVVEFFKPTAELLIGTLGPAITKIVKALFPPLLRISAHILSFLGVILTPIKLILKALSHLPGIGKAFEGVNDVIETLTGPELTQGLLDAADKIENSGDDLTKAAKKQEEAADGQQEAAKISASGGDLTLVESAKVNNANSQVSSTTQTTSESSADAQLKDLENKKKQKKEDNFRESVETKFDKVCKTLESLINLLASQNQKEFVVGPGVQQINLETGNEGSK